MRLDSINMLGATVKKKNQYQYYVEQEYCLILRYIWCALLYHIMLSPVYNLRRI